MATVPVLVAAFLAGLIAQWRLPVGGVRETLWQFYYHVLAPILVLTTFVEIEIAAALVSALTIVIIASWLVGALAYVHGALAARTRQERGALVLTGAFGNTNAVGLPVAQLMFGSQGLELAVVYDRLAWLVPTQSVSASVARSYGTDTSRQRTTHLRHFLLTNTPLYAMLVALGIRAVGIEFPALDVAQDVMLTIVGPVAFVLLGLSLPLDRPAHSPTDIRRAVETTTIRVVGGPLVVVALATATGVAVPTPFYVLAGMPCAFHLLTLARIYDLRPEFVRLAVLASTGLVLLVVGIAAAVR